MPVTAHRPDLPAGVLDQQGRILEDLAEEVADMGRADPRGAEPRLDLAGQQVLGDDLAQLRGVDGITRFVKGGLLGR